jgi:predicted dehydrogenase
MKSIKTKFIIVGAGNRGVGCFGKGLTGRDMARSLPEIKKRVTVTAIVDTNLSRARATACELGLPELPIFSTVAKAQASQPSDWAVIVTPDYTHCDVVTSALKAGLNVLVDKPLATSAWECDRIIRVMKETGRIVRVGHNMRYQPWTLKAKELMLAGAIGDVIEVEAAEALDYNHGGDYFHRWHSDFSKSAGLMNHKCCHHLDIVNWILDDDPVEVSAFGGRSFYVPRTDFKHAERCSECPRQHKGCPHAFDYEIWDKVWVRIYKNTETEDGYLRDRCVFSDRHTVNDHEVLNIRYKRGTLASFSLTTFSPREFCYFKLTGTKGRLEFGESPVDSKPYLRLLKADGSVDAIDFSIGAGEHGHGKADILLIADILGLKGSHQLQKAKPEEARRAVLIGDLAARSIAAGGKPIPASAAGKDFPPPPPCATAKGRKASTRKSGSNKR